MRQRVMGRLGGGWLVLGWFGFALLPWSAIGGRGFLAFDWLAGYPLALASAPALVQLVAFDRLWFLPFLVVLTAPIVARALRRPRTDAHTGALLIALACSGLAALLFVALAIDLRG